MTDIATIIREKYGKAARDAAAGAPAGCCSRSENTDPITSNLYVTGETHDLPPAAVLASLGCGNPTALADLNEGEVVLDLGSGGGIDVLLSARRVGKTGKVYGLDMTASMLTLARKNAKEAGVENVEFLEGNIESIPLPDNSIDVIISNCVINLSADKRAVLNEAFRVLKPGGRFAVSDVIARGEMPEAVKQNMELWCGCVAGALHESEFLALLNAAGFENASIEPTRIYEAPETAAILEGTGLDVRGFVQAMEGKLISGFVRATKPVEARRPLPTSTAKTCCGPECCS
ncbi:MAG TPA: arsenite methyltransferase [Gemmatimonadaceae bacterium]